MVQQHNGSCLCGDVTYEIGGEFDAFFLCHCMHCQKDTGSAHAANLFSSSASLTWKTGESQVQDFQLPGTRHARSFCKSCGSALPHYSDELKLLAVPAGSLDSTVPLEPNAHTFMKSRADWEEISRACPELQGLPGQGE